jgi:RimJ/RimL family protein N-acetyltransferase
MDTNLQLTDGLVLLRPPRAADAPAITAAARASLAELHPWLGWATPAYDENSARRALEFASLAWRHASGFQFAVTDAQTGEYLGNCGLDGLDSHKRTCNLSYWVRTRCAGQGIASRAARLAAHFAFETLGTVRIEIVIAAENLASQRVAQKIGAKYEKTLPEHLVVRTTLHDAVIYALTPFDL